MDANRGQFYLLKLSFWPHFFAPGQQLRPVTERPVWAFELRSFILTDELKPPTAAFVTLTVPNVESAFMANLLL